MTPQPNTGALFKNDRRTKDTHPHATGSVLIECPHCLRRTDYFADGYTNDGDKGKWQRLKFKVKEKQSGDATAKAQPVGDDDEIPF